MSYLKATSLASILLLLFAGGCDSAGQGTLPGEGSNEQTYPLVLESYPLVFEAYYSPVDDVLGHADIYLPLQGKLAPFADNLMNAKEPAWSPDGRTIAYVAQKEATQDPEIFLANPDGSSHRQLTDNAYRNRDPHWSPDGSRIVFTSRCDASEGPACAFVNSVDVRSGETTRLTSPDRFDADVPQWSPDGDRVVMRVNRGDDGSWVPELWVTDASGEGRARPLVKQFESVYFNSWSPDGSQFLFSKGAQNGEKDLYRSNADGSDVQQLTSNGTFRRKASWSPDGTTIAFVSSQNEDRGLYFMNPDGSNVRKVADLSTSEFVWSPDGSQVAITAGEDVYAFDVSAEAVRKIVDGTEGWYFSDLQWQP